MAGRIANVQRAQAMEAARPKTSLNEAINAVIDGEGMRRRFEELLGKRTPQFLSSLVTLLNATPQLKEAFETSPLTVIQSALKAASYDLPIDASLGYAYIVPFRNKGKMESQFIMGYKGMVQLALRTGAYKKINVVDVREGELRSYDRLTEDITIEWIEDEDVRAKAPIIGYVGFFRLTNGMEKLIYMSSKEISEHEHRHRKGEYMGMGWKSDYDAMCRKTVLRKLIGGWGLMSVDYQHADASTIAAATALAQGTYDDEAAPDVEENVPIDIEVDDDTGEVVSYAGTPFDDTKEGTNA